MNPPQSETNLLHPHCDQQEAGESNGTVADVRTSNQPEQKDDIFRRALQALHTLEVDQKRQPISKTAKWISNFSPLVVTIASFGGSITFTVFPALEKPPYSNLTAQEARTYLSLAWLLFMIALFVGCYASAWIDKDCSSRSGRSAYLYFALLSFVLQLSVVLPFFFLSHVVRGFSPPVGALGLACTGFVLLLIMVNSVFKVVGGKCAME